MRCLKIKTQDDNCEQATKNKHHSKPIYFDLMILEIFAHFEQDKNKKNLHKFKY